MRVGVVGAGKVGLTLARLMLREGIEVRVVDVNEDALVKATSLGIPRATTLEEVVAWGDHVMVSVPPKEVPRVLAEVRELVVGEGLEGRVIYDTSTFKEGVMREYATFPRDVKVASIHPMFGAGMRDPSKHVVAIVPVPGREDDASPVEELFRSLGFRVVRVSVEEHDDAVATYVGLSYVVATSLAATLAKRGPPLTGELSGTTFKLLLTHCAAVMSDDPGFIEYVVSEGRVRERAAQLLESLASLLEGSLSVGSVVRLFRGMVGEGFIREAYLKLYDVVEGLTD